ncbi:putative costunolide synthase [Heracleum sosnowskyi]|uniref:Costunolide synthase n=1 Tax=Heracleum sosnowskyi TaxID=360622 RepID=A0AAD8IR45_9APIA|nr:putative costunolide synthase [Heracleum sosnowskyi]
MHQVAGKIPHLALRELAEKCGPLMHLQLGEISTIVISNPRVAKEVLKTNDLACADKPELILGTIILANCRDIVLDPYGSGSPVNISDLVSKLSNVITWVFMANMFRSIKFLPLINGMKLALKKIRRKLDVIFDSIIKEHEQKLSNRKEGSEVVAEDEDLVDVLLRIKQSKRLEFPISFGDIQSLVLDMFTTGTDTSSAVLE